MHQQSAISEFEARGLNGSVALAANLIEVAKSDRLPRASARQFLARPRHESLYGMEHEITANQARTIRETFWPVVILGSQQQLWTMDRSCSQYKNPGLNLDLLVIPEHDGTRHLVWQRLKLHHFAAGHDGRLLSRFREYRAHICPATFVTQPAKAFIAARSIADANVESIRMQAVFLEELYKVIVAGAEWWWRDMVASNCGEWVLRAGNMKQLLGLYIVGKKFAITDRSTAGRMWRIW